MSQENVDVIRRGYQHWTATGEIRAHPDFIWDVSNLGWPDQQIYSGAEGANRFNAEWAEAWDDWKLEVEELIDAGDQVVVLVNQHGRSKATGVPVHMRFAQVWTLRDGQGIRMQMYADPDEALESVGLRHHPGTVLPYDEIGAGPTVMLLHAGVADRTMWADLLPAVAAAGYRTVAVDLPGHGEAPAAGGAPHSAVLDTLDALEIDRAVLVGNSFGGAVALRVAAVAPERVAALVLISTDAPGVEPSSELEAVWAAEESALERGDVEGAVAAVVDAWTLPDAPPALRDHIAASQRRAFESHALAGESPELEDPLEPDSSALSTLDSPALVAYGEFDMSDFRVGAEVLAQELRQSRLVVIPKAGHLAPLEEPDAVRELVLEYLRESHPS